MLFRFLGVTCLCGAVAFAQQPERPQVLFSGSPHPARSKTVNSASSPLTDAERMAIAVTAWDLDVHLMPSQQSMEVHARVTLQNDGLAPLSSVPLQLSSTLHFEQVGLNGKRLPFAQTIIDSDADHSGELQQALISLPQPLTPGASLSVTIDYGGAIPLTAKRLTAIGAPEDAAEASDWDRISQDFTGLRGFGDVVWYPVSSVPVSLGRGATLFNEIGRQKLRSQDATVALRITDEFTSDPPSAAILDGHYIALNKPESRPSASFPGVISCSLPATRLGFEAPSLFLGRRTETDGNGLRVLATDAGNGNAQGYVNAAGTVESLVGAWLGNKQHAPFTIFELPENGDAAAETGDVLAIPLTSQPPSSLAPIVAHGLAHAAFWSPRAWLNEGVANFIGALWIESTQGQTAALENLNADRPALALAEPGTPGQGSGEDLLHAESAVYYRTKATYVLWMLRDLAGDKPLQSALQAYDPAQDSQPDYFEHLLEKASGKDLRWFFDDWVYRDRGLPDLSITAVHFSPEEHQQSLVAIDITNDGYAEAEVPVTVQAMQGSVTDHVRIPAHGSMTHRMTIQGNPVEVDVNDGSVPEVQDSIHRRMINESQP